VLVLTVFTAGHSQAVTGDNDDNDICQLMSLVSVTLVSQITQPRHCLHHLLPPKTSTHCPYGLRKRQHYQQLPQVEYTQYMNSFINRCLFNFWWLHICNDNMLMGRQISFGYWLKWRFDYHFFRFLVCILSLLVWMFLNTHVTVCICHAELNGYDLLTYWFDWTW